jgi:hypothetical protein
LHEELCRARGLPLGFKDALPDGFQPGDLIAWLDLWRTVPLELVDADGATWVVQDHHCAVPALSLREHNQRMLEVRSSALARG